MAKPKFKANDVYTEDEAAALIQHVLSNLARIENAVNGTAQSLFVLASLGAARCSRIIEYNLTARQLYETQVGVLKAMRDSLWQAAQKTSGTDQKTILSLLNQVPKAPRDPVYFGNGTGPQGQIVMNCQAQEYPDPASIKMYGKLIPGDCPVAGDGSAQGQALKGIGICAGAIAGGPQSLLACGLVALTAVALGAFALKGLGILGGIVKELRIAIRGGDLEEDAKLAELDHARAKFIENCVSNQLADARTRGVAMDSNARVRITDACEKGALVAFPNRGRRTSFWLTLIPIGLIAGTVLTVYFVTRKKSSRSKAMVPA